MSKITTMSLHKKFHFMNALFFITIVLTSCSIALENNFDYNNCGVYQHQVTILHKNNSQWNNIDTSYLIHPRAVLTPAHIVADFKINDLGIAEAIWPVKSLIYNVLKMFIHPEYNLCTGSKDFAILIFEKPFLSKYKPICLPDKKFINQLKASDCYEVDNYYLRYSSSGIEGNCQKLDSFFFKFKTKSIDSQECLTLLNRTSDIIGDRVISKRICRITRQGGDLRRYYYSHKYSGTLCQENKNGYYTTLNANDYISDITRWIKQIINRNM